MTTDPRSDSSEAGFPRRFGRYVLITPVGTGGMGRVYAALTPRGELCVVKRFGSPHARLPAHLIEQNKVRFVREADITKALDHPSIAKTYESVHDGAASYLVQEHVDGMTVDFFMGALRDHNESLSIQLATYIAKCIANALAYLHDFRGLGLIHRDLTATNVMVSRDGDVKVIDFGIAKATLVAEELTQPNLVVGKPLWTTPEVRGGAKPDRRTDLYALGLLYWYLLTGEDPTDHLDGDATKQLPRPSTFRPDIPPDLDALVLVAVDGDPRRRFQTASEFLTAIDPFLPSQFKGAPELAALVRRNDLSSADEFFAKLVEGARPLLAEAPASSAPSASAVSRTARFLRPLGRWRIWGAVAVGIIAVTALLIWGRESPNPPPSSGPEKSHSSSSEATTLVAPSSPLPDRGVPPVTAPAATGDQSTASVTASATRSTTAVATQPSAPAPAPSRAERPTSKPRPRLPEEPSPSPTPPNPEELLDAAMQATVAGDTARAVRLARASIDARPSADAYILIGKLLSSSDPTLARAALEAALRLSPGNRQATSLLQLLNR